MPHRVRAHPRRRRVPRRRPGQPRRSDGGAAAPLPRHHARGADDARRAPEAASLAATYRKPPKLPGHDAQILTAPIGKTGRPMLRLGRIVFFTVAALIAASVLE